MTTRIETEDVVEHLQSAIWKLLLSATSVDADVRNEADDAMKQAVAHIERLRKENARRDALVKEAFHEALARYPDAKGALTFFWTASGLAEIAPTDEQVAWARAALTPSADDDK
jgi:hypothetical protein